MEPEPLQFLADRLKLAYYPKDAVILSTASGVPKTLHILQRGKVVASQPTDVRMLEYSSLTLGPGECFPIGSVMAQRPSTNAYTALEDVFCYELAAEDFFALVQQSTVFNLFCTQYIASLLSQSRQLLQSQFSQRVAEQQTMNSPLSRSSQERTRIGYPRDADPPGRRADGGKGAGLGHRRRRRKAAGRYLHAF